MVYRTIRYASIPGRCALNRFWTFASPVCYRTAFGFSILLEPDQVCLLLPTLISTTEEPSGGSQYQREAAWRWAHQMGALPMLSARALPRHCHRHHPLCGPALGETACLYVTMGGSSVMPRTSLSGGRTLALHVYYIATETNAFEKAMATAAILIILIIIINTLTNWLSRRFHTRLVGRM
jgi:phosphate transport system permease protein